MSPSPAGPAAGFPFFFARDLPIAPPSVSRAVEGSFIPSAMATGIEAATAVRRSVRIGPSSPAVFHFRGRRPRGDPTPHGDAGLPPWVGRRSRGLRRRGAARAALRSSEPARSAEAGRCSLRGRPRAPATPYDPSRTRPFASPGTWLRRALPVAPRGPRAPRWAAGPVRDHRSFARVAPSAARLEPPGC